MDLTTLEAARDPAVDLARLVASELDSMASAAPGDRERRRDGLAALLLAVKRHYPSVWRERFAGGPAAEIVAEPPSGRVIKLARIARARLAGVL